MTDLGGLAFPEVDGRSVLVVPLGSTEQHGPHLPLDTDTVIAVELCRRLRRGRDDVIVAPAVVYGSSGEHSGFTGTLSIGARVIEELVVELCRSAGETFDRVLLVCGHGGNVESVTRAVRRLNAESRDVLLFTPTVRGDAHAGHVETSIMLAIKPECVRGDRLVAGDLRPLSEIWPTLRASGVRGVTETGVLGDATTANSDDGRRIMADMTADLVATLETWVGRPAVVSAS